MEKIKGLIVAPFTAFGKDLEINLSPISDYAKMLKKNSLKGVFINGSSGEGYMLNVDERKKLAEEWMKFADEDFKVIVHVGSTTLKDAVELAKHAQEIKAFGTGAMAPPFPKIGRIQELFDYCKAIADAAPEIPFYYYHIPVFNGAYLPMLDFLKKVNGEIPNFAGIKYTYENLYEFNQCSLYENGKFQMLHGQDETLLAGLALSDVKGGISGTANYTGKGLIEVLNYWENKDLNQARAAQNYNQAVINVIVKYGGNIVGGKRIMKLMGLDLGKNRIPFKNLTDAEESQLKKDLEEIDFFNHCNEL